MNLTTIAFYGLNNSYALAYFESNGDKFYLVKGDKLESNLEYHVFSPRRKTYVPVCFKNKQCFNSPQKGAMKKAWKSLINQHFKRVTPESIPEEVRKQL